MKTTVSLIAFLLWFNAFSQTATLLGHFENAGEKRTLSLSRPFNLTQFPSEIDTQLIPLNKGMFSMKLVLNHPEIMYLTSYVNDTVEFRQPLFLKSGYAIHVFVKSINGNIQLTCTGRGAKDNQPWTMQGNIDFKNYPKDTLPDRIVSDLQKIATDNKDALKDYITKNAPSADFVQSWNTELQYTPVRVYYVYSKQRKYYVRQAYYRNINKWNEKLDQLLKEAPLMNEAALYSSSYRLLLKMYLIFNKAEFEYEAGTDKNRFMQEWYSSIRDTGSRSFEKDPNNIPNQKIIERKFTGKVKEYLYAHLFKMALESGKTDNIEVIYTDFSKEYPNSPYKKIYDKPVAEVFASLNQLSNKNIIIENGKINTWSEVLDICKGKTVFVDLWGTWCGPCREELRNNTTPLKKYFQNRGLDYLYIAIDDEENGSVWRSLVTLFNLEGHHIIASKELKSSIMKEVNVTGFPTYVLIHKDGSFELTASLSEKETLIKQIETALQ
ncbi:MAG: TlpA family protein disulfide reductase [Bacteroidetes bacterium]|nr:TlpA family protein disulfide reductase [Bacteroidota bacterium]